jgi:hypothetical protein
MNARGGQEKLLLATKTGDISTGHLKDKAALAGRTELPRGNWEKQSSAQPVPVLVLNGLVVAKLVVRYVQIKQGRPMGSQAS